MTPRRPAAEIGAELAEIRSAIRRATIDYRSDPAVDHLTRDVAEEIERLAIAVAQAEGRAGT